VTRLSAKTDRLMNSAAIRSPRKVSTIARPPMSGGSSAATRLRKNHSESRNSSGSASNSARARSLPTVLPTSCCATADPPTFTPGCPLKAAITRSAVFDSSAVRFSQPST
jgi:hypothetical protein